MWHITLKDDNNINAMGGGAVCIIIKVTDTEGEHQGRAPETFTKEGAEMSKKKPYMYVFIRAVKQLKKI